MSNLRINSTVVLIGKIYTATISIVLLPYLLNFLGKEQYGLIGSFVVLQACMQILDAGVSGALTRQSILTQGNHKSFENFIVKLKYIFIFFISIATILILLGSAFAGKYSTSWFNSSLDDSVIVSSVSIMVVIFALKYFQGPMRSILLSYERHKALTLLDILYASLSGPVSLYILININGDVTTYFYAQLIAILFLVIITAIYTWMETTKVRLRLKYSESTGAVIETNVKDVVKFGMQLSLLSILWVIVNQSDKITLTKYMVLSEYSFYAIAISILGVLSIFVSTLIQIVRPRLIVHFKNQAYDSFSELFKVSVISLVSLLVPLVVFLVYFGEKLLFFWSGDSELSIKVMQYLPYLLVGSLFVSMSEFSFMILYSTGNLKAHTIFYSIVSLFIIPLNVVISSKYLGEGSSQLFMIVHLLLFLTWSIYNIKKYLSHTAKLFSLSMVFSASVSALMVLISIEIFDKINLFWLGGVFICGLLTVLVSFFLLVYFLRDLNVSFNKGVI
jgi:O-antigen/teichoic acid export membrane protein